LFCFYVDVVDTDGFDTDIFDVGSEVVKVADRVCLDDLCGGTIEEDLVSRFGGSIWCYS